MITVNSIWRPITTPFQDCPLALCDFRTVSAHDLVPADIVFPHCPDEAYEILHNPSHRWLYKQGMAHDDVVVFKLADTASNVAKCTIHVLLLQSELMSGLVCPHSAFVDQSVPDSTPERASIEIRAILIE